ncbi:hypothetical protein ATANTOWER_015059 [Ataeniobius toweri]|uniref:Uncharacterized protein n=1 Tax=Ataeniobius toweri TaxID=208326 RepID=A0ABU7AFG0_9TELE|nr:hypothetical protein [Ataeniobius toweri]
MRLNLNSWMFFESFLIMGKADQSENGPEQHSDRRSVNPFKACCLCVHQVSLDTQTDTAVLALEEDQSELHYPAWHTYTDSDE